MKRALLFLLVHRAATACTIPALLLLVTLHAATACTIPAHSRLLFPDDCDSWECHLGFVRSGDACCPMLEHYCVTACNASGYTVQHENCSKPTCARGAYFDGQRCAACPMPLPVHAFWFQSCVWACEAPWIRAENYCRIAAAQQAHSLVAATVSGETSACPVAKYERLLSRFYRAQATVVSISDGAATHMCPCACSGNSSVLYLVYSVDTERTDHARLMSLVRNIVEIHPVESHVVSEAVPFVWLVAIFVCAFAASTVAVWMRYRRYTKVKLSEQEIELEEAKQSA